MDLLCYNKGCGKRFNESENTEDACSFHPGAPVFHDALKGWSCCKKRSTDFTDFLNIPGCTRGKHNHVKPVEPVSNPVKPLAKGEVIEVRAPEIPKPKAPIPRPLDDEPCVDLKVNISNSLKTALARLRKTMEESQVTSAAATTSETDDVAIGTECKHSGCQTTYIGPESNLSDCQFHPGIAIFHEGYKYWSCCRKRTSDFNEFLRQEGCKTGNHTWVSENEDNVRCDWHQTGSQVIISIFSKCAVPEDCHFTANSTTVTAVISYDGGKKQFTNTWNLEGVIDARKSSVELLGSKAEIKLRKADGMAWKWKYLILKKPVEPKKSDIENGEN